eukprot:6113893-Pyramimonas_sp.AAC.1
MVAVACEALRGSSSSLWHDDWWRLRIAVTTPPPEPSFEVSLGLAAEKAALRPQPLNSLSPRPLGPRSGRAFPATGGRHMSL